LKNQFVQISGGLGNEMYRTSCCVCGNPVFTWVKRQGVKFKCKSCREVERQLKKEKNSPLRMMEAERRLEIAIDYLESKRILQDYSAALDIVGKNIYRPGWFQSSNEILVALELIRNRVKVRHQVKYGRWKADFVIPDWKVVLEVDGSLYHKGDRKEKDRIRDAAIIAHLGPEWEIIRISEEMIRLNIKKLIPAIKRIKRERAKVRKSSGNGVLPSWYSDNQL